MKRNSGSLCFPFLYQSCKRGDWKKWVHRRMPTVCSGGQRSRRCLWRPLGWQEEAASCLLAPSSCRHPCVGTGVLSTGFSSSSFSFFPQIWVEEETSDSTPRWGLYWASFSVGSSWSSLRSAAWCSPVFFPRPPFLEWFLAGLVFLIENF